jgi:hypothetical protein
VGKTSSNLASRGDMGWNATTVKQRKEVFRLHIKIFHMEENRLPKNIQDWSLKYSKSYVFKTSKLLKSYGASWMVENGADNNDWSVSRKLRLLDELLVLEDKDLWKKELFNDQNNPNGNKLRTYRMYKNENTTSDYVKLVRHRKHRSVLAKFRNGSLPLTVELGRFAKPPVALQNRICRYCHLYKNIHVVEDESHFLLHCDVYSDIRCNLFHKANVELDTFYSLSSEDKMYFILNHHGLQTCLASTISNMLLKRQKHHAFII